MTQPHKIAQFDNLGCLGVVALQLGKRFVNHQQLGIRSSVSWYFVLQILAAKFTTMPDRRLAPRPLNQNPTHRLGRGREEVAPTIPKLRLVGIDKSQIRLMHKCGCLQCLSRFLLREPGGRKFTKFIVNQWQ